MKRFLVVLLAAALLVGCATKKNEDELVIPSSVSAEKGGVEAADWWNNPPEDTEDTHYEVGMAKGSNEQSSRMWAQSNANQQLAQYVSNAVDAVRVSYLNDAGSGADMQAVQSFESLGKERAQAVLTGVKYKYWTAKDGSCYVLAALPIGKVAEELKTVIQESFKRSTAAAAANEMMNDALEKYFASGKVPAAASVANE